MAKFKKIEDGYQTEYGTIKKMLRLAHGYNAVLGRNAYFTQTRWVAEDYEFKTRKEAYEFLKDKSSITSNPKYKVGDTIVMKDNEDYEITIELIEEDCDGFIYYEGSDEYAGSIREEDAILSYSCNENSVYNTFNRLLQS